ncbi:hypothetical protein CASFOL_003941 [Castilleja foliolosa]|uniref:Uncharacterized protein n=1 Tax=Castilleja foliolosa TaxID=1961234 RepID=A0ABD3EIZ8_9LAMI
MTVANAQIFAIPKPLFSGIPISRRPPFCVSFRQFTDVNIPKPLFSGTPISRRPPYCAYSRQLTDKFAFLDTVDDSPWPMLTNTHYEVFIKRSYLKSDATEQEKMDFYLETATLIVHNFYLFTDTRIEDSEEDAKERIYKVSRDCSFWLDSVEIVCPDGTELEYMDGEMVKWSMKPKRREKGRFPIPKPELPWL